MKFDSPEMNEAVAQDMRNQGCPITAKQVREERRKAYATIREKMAEKGITLPDDDEELCAYLCRILKP